MSLRGHRAETLSLVSMDRYLIATVGAMQVAFPADAVQGLLTLTESGAGGPLAVQGQVYEAVDLASRLGLSPGGDGPDTRVLLLAQGASRASVRVDRVHGLVEFERRQLLPLPRQFRGEERGWYAGMLLFDEGISVVLRTPWLLDRAESASSGIGCQVRPQPLLPNIAQPTLARGAVC